MTAFVAPTPIPTRRPAVSLSDSRRLPSATPARRPLRALMAGDTASIDFGKVDIQGAGESLAGLVFTPEGDIAIKTRCDVGYTSEQEAAINRHINVEYTASYAYHAIWAYFDKDVVALPGFAKFFKEQSNEEREHAEEFMKFQNKRGGSVELQPIAVPEMKFTMDDGTSDAVYAMDLHLQLEKFVYLKLKELHKVAENADDPQMQDFVEDYMGHQVDAIKTAADYVAQLKRVGTPHGVYHIDLTLREGENAV
eukprot:GFKZ01000356.1.p2 GENE.GFKZ01000356.1~~GFKZ01000356.1.p2  ORF type:complete len:252 (-),score=58.12 GFKZ01000356.1:1879-2634(-)